MNKFKDNLNDFFKWVKGTELVELNDIDVSEDPVRPELTLGFRITHDRKILGLKYDDEIEAIVCVVFCPEVPYTVREMDYMSRVEMVLLLLHILYGHVSVVQVKRLLIKVFQKIIMKD